MSSAQRFAMSRISSRLRTPKGWGTSAMGSSGAPSAFACAWPSVPKAVEHTVTAMRPRFAASTLSWTLHDVQDPQSPDPVMTRSHSRASAAMTSSGAGTEAERFLRFTTRAAP